ncbi:XRE family transcriptional regulator [Cryobacterium lactosi]|uniref:XRE family transcriptional regulator n=1 Tax=Cryobacterium lactosi TaxID=1259202 RepID=A0A4R9BIB0_9MICO|nr:helix-turn-helix domain-containing protein [Cryobacterium lactosi]TFD85012.1 XRE family transcriptional regulator [Cryobacterium lactosi]
MELFDGPTIGARVARYRKMNGQSAEELALRAGAGFSRPVIANIETGRKKELSVSQLVGLSVGLGIAPAALLFDIYKPFGNSGIRRINGSQDGSYAQVITAVAWLAGRATLPELGDEMAAETHTQSVLGGTQLLDAERFQQDANRDQIARLQRQMDTTGLPAREVGWLEYLKDQMQAREQRIAELVTQLTALGVEVSEPSE